MDEADDLVSETFDQDMAKVEARKKQALAQQQVQEEEQEQIFDDAFTQLK